MNPQDSLPPELEQLDHALRGIRFRPRASFGPELLGRLRRGERSKGVVRPWRSRPALGAIAALVALAVGAALLIWPKQDVEVDRCCYDFDGGGKADDGVILVAQRNGEVHRLRVYEDRDHSGGFSKGDLIRLDRVGDPSMQIGSTSNLVTTEHCCLDFDGGGPQDDAFLVIGVPPDRVMMAAIYEHGAVGGSSSAAVPDAFPLR
jgi:hypothetical protein